MKRRKKESGLNIILSRLLCYDDCDDMARPRIQSTRWMLRGYTHTVCVCISIESALKNGSSRGQKKKETDGFSSGEPRQPRLLDHDHLYIYQTPPACVMPTMKNESRQKRQQLNDFNSGLVLIWPRLFLSYFFLSFDSPLYFLSISGRHTHESGILPFFIRPPPYGLASMYI